MTIYGGSRTICLLAVFIAAAPAFAGDGELHGVQASDIDRKAQPCTTSSSSRTAVARRQPDPAVHGALEPALGRGGGRQGPASRDPRSGCLEQELRRAAPSSSSATTTPPAWTRQAADKLGAQPLEPMLREIDADRQGGRPPDDDRALHAIGVIGAVRPVRRLRQPRSDARDRATLSPAASGCPTATTT